MKRGGRSTLIVPNEIVVEYSRAFYKDFLEARTKTPLLPRSHKVTKKKNSKSETSTLLRAFVTLWRHFSTGSLGAIAKRFKGSDQKSESCPERSRAQSRDEGSKGSHQRLSDRRAFFVIVERYASGSSNSPLGTVRFAFQLELQ